MTRTVGVRAITLAAALLAALPAWSQKGGTTGTTGSTGGATGTTGTTGTTNPTTSTTGVSRTPTTIPGTTQPGQTTGIPQPIFLSGRVVTEDGSLPGESIVLQTVCNGRTHSEGYADAKGYFAIELGANRGMIVDASEYGTGRIGPTFGTVSGASGSGLNSGMDAEHKYMGCELVGKLAGYRSQSISLTGRRPMDDPNVGTILLHRIGAQEEGRTVSMASLGAPKDAKKAYDKGMEALKKGKLADAQNNFEKAVEIYPSYSVAWYELGRLRARQDQLDIARGSFQEAIKADPKFVLPYLGLSMIELETKRWPQLADITEKTAKLNSFDYPQIFFFNSVANFNLHNFEAAEKSGLEAERLDTRHEYPQVFHVLGMILADRKEWDAAALRFKEYLRLNPKGSNAETVRAQLAQVERIQQQLARAKDR